MASTPCFIFVTGGVLSSIGKGITTASLGLLMQSRGLKVKLRKFDPYLNVDPGTMNPTQHGEVFVTDDGSEADLDLGHYERFTGIAATNGDNVTAGKIYSELLTKERRGDYLGNTVQVIPHVTDLIKYYITNNIAGSDIVICEIGGTIGDIEGQPFFEAIRQMRYELGCNRTVFIHLTWLPHIETSCELKTKPTQHSVKQLNAAGIQPDIILCRANQSILNGECKKIAAFCNVREENVITAPNVDNIYEIPILYYKNGLDQQILEHFQLNNIKSPDWQLWENVLADMKNCQKQVKIALVGKYTQLNDAYKSIIESLDHGGVHNRVKVQIKWIDAKKLTADTVKEAFQDVDGIIIPGGFGHDGVDGKILAANYARCHNIPFLGICLGMQLAIIEIARNLANMPGAHSTEFDSETNAPVVSMLEEWQNDDKLEVRLASGNLGGTMRVGSYPCILSEDSLAYKVYGTTTIEERHRHRYEFNIQYKNALEAVGVKFSGHCAHTQKLLEIIELSDHPWFVGVQFHPEFKSTLIKPHRLFISFIQAAIATSI